MGFKKYEHRFTIYLNKTDPNHLRVAEILNELGYRGKAQYVVNAVLQYTETVNKSSVSQHIKAEMAIANLTSNAEEHRDSIDLLAINSITGTLNAFRRNGLPSLKKS